MTAENPRGKPSKDNQPHEIMLGVPFRPYEKTKGFLRPGEGGYPFSVPESYEHIILLRKEVSFLGLKGCIDVISEDKDQEWGPLFSRYPASQPLGVAAFIIDYYGANDQRTREQPFILRFSFALNNPAEYAKLLNTYADVECGKKNYNLFWNFNEMGVRRNMTQLEAGEKAIVAEKNLFDGDEIKMTGDGDIEKEERDRTRDTFVWLPLNPKKLRTIKMSFQKFYGGQEQEEPIKPITPDRKRASILVL